MIPLSAISQTSRALKTTTVQTRKCSFVFILGRAQGEMGYWHAWLMVLIRHGGLLVSWISANNMTINLQISALPRVAR